MSVVHGLLSLHTLTAPGTHSPPAHVSFSVQTLPSEHSALLLLFLHPTLASQVSLVQVLPSLQFSAVPGWHAPAPHTSPLVQALLSVQARVLLLCTQPPAALQASVVHGLASSHLSAAPGWHAPFAHVSLTVQSLPSLQGALLCVNAQPLAGLQTSLVHGLPSLQVTVVPPTHVPPLQVSP